ncbi:MAG: acyl-CoA dehydrogenase family protein, partial [Deltaproteobacteria bacterium]|nr:acyl-CoA dehydrogenase family protein [Deltaproteobacteria bacterium]
MSLGLSYDLPLFTPTEEHDLLRKTVRDFARKEVAPQAEEHDQSGTLNVALLKKCGELGLHGITVPEQDGGAGLDAVASVIVHEELAYYDPGFALAYLAHALLFVNNFYYAATSAQRDRYLARTMSSEWIGAMGMSEPATGTDVLGMKTIATRDGDDYILNGRKTFITNGPEADVYVVYAQLDERITTFVVERAFEGFSTSEKISKVGMRASTMCELIMDNVRVPAGNLLGKEGGGVTNMMRNLEIERLGLAAMSLGIARRCVDVMVRYASDRKAFGQSLHGFGQIQRHIGESYAKLEAIRSLVYQVANATSPTTKNRLGTDAAKLFCSTA